MTDKDLKQHVENSLEYEPGINAKDIGVSADEGVVTLRGNVAWYGRRLPPNEWHCGCMASRPLRTTWSCGW